MNRKAGFTKIFVVMSKFALIFCLKANRKSVNQLIQRKQDIRVQIISFEKSQIYWVFLVFHITLMTPLNINPFFHVQNPKIFNKFNKIIHMHWLPENVGQVDTSESETN